MFHDFCEITGFYEKPKRKRKNDYSDIHEFIRMSDDVRKILLADKELLRIHSSIIPGEINFDDDYHTLTQDFIYTWDSTLWWGLNSLE